MKKMIVVFSAWKLKEKVSELKKQGYKRVESPFERLGKDEYELHYSNGIDEVCFIYDCKL
jgi:hypothetical protein